MIKRIHLILDKEQIQCEDEVVRIITQLSDGGMRDALSIFSSIPLLLAASISIISGCVPSVMDKHSVPI